MIRHVIFDFFGTLASYEPSAERHSFANSMALLAEFSVDLTEAQFSARFQGVFNDLNADAAASLCEFSMADVVGAFFGGLDERLTDADTNRFIRAYIDDWSRHVRLLPRLAMWLSQLPQTKSVLSNTHDNELVPGHLAAAAIQSHFDLVTLSVVHGRRKPHPDIYLGHMAELGIDPRETAYVGDDPECDYLGPRREGLRAYLIAPRPVAGVAEAHRLRHLFELSDRLRDERHG